MPSSVLLRPTTIADAAALRSLRLEALTDTPEAFGTTYAETVAWPAAKWDEMATSPSTFVAVIDGEIRAMARGGYHDHRPDTWWLWGMYVSPSARGTGTAAAMVRRVANWARHEGATSLHLYVGSAVARARAFYAKVGFTFTGEPFAMERDPTMQFQEMVLELEPLPVLTIRRCAPEELFDLRRRILRFNDPSADVTDPRDHDETALHFGGEVQGRLVACASVYPARSPFHPDVDAYVLRYVATDEAVQGCGFGGRLLLEVEHGVAALGCVELWANARDSALGFYRSEGWSLVEGTEHLSPYTGLPHTQIVKRLD